MRGIAMRKRCRRARDNGSPSSIWIARASRVRSPTFTAISDVVSDSPLEAVAAQVAIVANSLQGGSLMVIHAALRTMMADSSRLWSVRLLYFPAVLSAEGFGG
jgi:hypothetical protein